MKFGQNLPRNQVPEWASSYIDYKALKKVIKTAQRAIADGDDPDLAGTVSLAWDDAEHYPNNSLSLF